MLEATKAIMDNTTKTLFDRVSIQVEDAIRSGAKGEDIIELLEEMRDDDISDLLKRIDALSRTSSNETKSVKESLVSIESRIRSEEISSDLSEIRTHISELIMEIATRTDDRDEKLQSLQKQVNKLQFTVIVATALIAVNLLGTILFGLIY